MAFGESTRKGVRRMESVGRGGRSSRPNFVHFFLERKTWFIFYLGERHVGERRGTRPLNQLRSLTVHHKRQASVVLSGVI